MREEGNREEIIRKWVRPRWSEKILQLHVFEALGNKIDVH